MAACDKAPAGSGVSAISHLRSCRDSSELQSLWGQMARMQADMGNLREQVHQLKSRFDMQATRDEGSVIEANSTIVKPQGGNTIVDAEISVKKWGAAELLKRTEDLLRQVRIEHQLEQIEEATKYTEPEGFQECLLSESILEACAIPPTP